MISSVVSHLVSKLRENKTIQDFFSDFADATVRWIRPIFLTEDEKPTEVLKDLGDAPDDRINTQAAENALAKAARKDPGGEDMIRAMYEIIKRTGEQKASNQIIHSKNVVTGSIHGSGNIVVGDQHGKGPSE